MSEVTAQRETRFKSEYLLSQLYDISLRWESTRAEKTLTLTRVAVVCCTGKIVWAQYFSLLEFLKTLRDFIRFSSKGRLFQFLVNVCICNEVKWS